MFSICLGSVSSVGIFDTRVDDHEVGFALDVALADSGEKEPRDGVLG